MARPRQPSAQTIAVVAALAEQPATWRYGYQLCRQLDLKPGSLYPILVRLADRGLLETTWDNDVPAGRPPRHSRPSGQAAASPHAWPPTRRHLRLSRLRGWVQSKAEDHLLMRGYRCWSETTGTDEQRLLPATESDGGTCARR